MLRPHSLPLLLVIPGLLAVAEIQAQQLAHLEIDSPFGSFVEEDFPFFTQTLDAREFGAQPEPANLTPRGIIVKLGEDHYGCFDPDLLRWALIWRANDEGEFMTMDGMAPGSYRLPNRKAPAGQESLPRPIGTPLSATPALPGWYPGNPSSSGDPRDRGTSDPAETGIGPIPAEMGRFQGIDISSGAATLVYQVGEKKVRETASVEIIESKPFLHRDLEIQNATGETLSEDEVREFVSRSASPSMIETKYTSNEGTAAQKEVPRRWTQTITLPLPNPTSEGGSLVFDDLPLPVSNPWKRNVRLSGFDFFPDGRAVACTFDGDVWIIDGLEESSSETSWLRFASGLHEPQTVCIVDQQIYVSDRNGITRLHDTDGNGEADWYENFSNIVPQTAETREFAMDMVAAKGGGFYLAKGGQVGNTKGIANGTIVKVSADGLSYQIIATGLRQPYLGYNHESGILTSSDQQGHWKPATPIYQIEEGKYYGFQPAKFKEKAIHPAPIAPPEIWIPHFINQSGASQVWLPGEAKMGALNGSLIHLGYNRPEIFKIYLDEDRTQGAVIPLLSGFPAGILKGRVNPLDGRLYICGFEVWGTSGERVSGLFRIRPGTPNSFLPTNIKATQRGLLLNFNAPLSRDLAGEIGRYSVDRWNYEQTHNYGSGNFRLDGEPGQESVPVSSAMLSKDLRSLFIGLPDMQPSHSLRLTYRLPHSDVTAIESLYLTIHSLKKVDLTELGFEHNQVDLRVRTGLSQSSPAIKPTPQLGKEVATRYGCIACHATDKSKAPAAPANSAEGALVAVGPPWTGLWKSYRTFTDGSFIKKVDESYLRESILDPGRRVAEGYNTEKTGVGMPSYLGVLKDHEIESIILYIQALK
ncbi:MAG: c-type cytochrome [Verrucomicrobiales bacterium]|nr:c-type cytochrome [Verrucomicrobiales bacterium]